MRLSVSLLAVLFVNTDLCCVCAFVQSGNDEGKTVLHILAGVGLLKPVQAVIASGRSGPDLDLLDAVRVVRCGAVRVHEVSA